MGLFRSDRKMTCLVFASSDDAKVANDKIGANMGLTGNITERWANIAKRTTDSKPFIAKPETKYMSSVTKYTEEESTVDWYPWEEQFKQQ